VRLDRSRSFRCGLRRSGRRFASRLWMDRHRELQVLIGLMRESRVRLTALLVRIRTRQFRHHGQAVIDAFAEAALEQRTLIGLSRRLHALLHVGTAEAVQIPTPSARVNQARHHLQRRVGRSL
jgi:hypothetical protein